MLLNGGFSNVFSGKRRSGKLDRLFFVRCSFRNGWRSGRGRQLGRGTMREFATEFYKSRAWQSCRASYAKSKHNLCERCMSKGIFKPGEIVHHKIHLTPENIKDPEIALNWDNLELLCRDCHGLAHRPEKRYKVDEFGRVIII